MISYFLFLCFLLLVRFEHVNVKLGSIIRASLRPINAVKADEELVFYQWDQKCTFYGLIKMFWKARLTQIVISTLNPLIMS
jgi:hypothetical protein